jgi:hypothetical protein
VTRRTRPERPESPIGTPDASSAEVKADPDAAASARATSTPARRRRWRLFPRRWPGRFFFLLVLLLLLALIVTQIVLWTNVPRNLVLEQLEKQLGLRVEAKSLSTSWLGDTALRDVTISLPLETDSMLRVPRMRVEHNTLLGLAWTRAVKLDLVELHDVHLVVQQDPSGRWNLQRVLDLLARTGGKQPAAQQAQQSHSRPTLPALRIVNATVDVIDRAGRTSSVAPVNVSGDPIDAITWKYDVSAGSQLALTGRLVTGGTWEHEVDIKADQVQAWAKPFAGDVALPTVSMNGQWHGELRDGGVAGRLVVGGLDVGTNHAIGAMSVRSEAGGVVRVTPENLVVHTAQRLVPEVRVSAGKVSLDGKSLSAESLTLLTFNGVTRVDGRYDWSNQSADLSAKWSDLAMPDKQVTASGALTLAVRSPPGARQLDAHLTSTGTMPAGGWDAAVDLAGSGRDWSNVDWQLNAKKLDVKAWQDVRLDGLAASVQTRGSVVSITGMHGPGDVTARGRGSYDLATSRWDLRVDLSNLPRPLSISSNAPLEFNLNARGDAEKLVLENPGISLRGKEAELRVEGKYVYNIPKPVDVTVLVHNVPKREMTSTTDAQEPRPVFGFLEGKARVVGTAFKPRRLEIAGKIVTRDVNVRGRPIGSPEVTFSGTADDQRVALQTDKLQLLGGQWQLDALFPDHGMLGVNVIVDGLSLKDVGPAIDRPDLGGAVDAKVALVVPRPQAEAVKLTAVIKGKDLKYGTGETADQLDATVVLADGTLRVDPVRLRKGQGQANLGVELDVREYRKLSANLSLAGWPFEPVPGTSAQLWGGTSGLRITFPGATLREGIRRGVFSPEFRTQRLWVLGPIDLSANFTLKDKPAGSAHIVADLNGRQLDLRSVSYDGLDGTVQGQALVDFDKPLLARGSLFFEDFDATRIPEFFPENPTLIGLRGRYSGAVHLAPATGVRPLGPVRITADVRNVAGRYRSVDVGPIRFSAFTNYDRLVIEDSPENPTTVDLAGGLVRVWGRFSVLEAGDELNPAAKKPIALSQVQVSFGNLDLDQLVHAFKPDADRMDGKVAGSFQALAGTRPGRKPGAGPSGQGPVEKIVRRITADGRVALRESELANLDVVAFFYNALSLSPNPEKPEGHGDVSFHLEDGTLALNNIHYFNRGAELRAIADVEQVWKMPDSPVHGTAVGTARPFRDLKLPFLSTYDLDTIVTLLQTNLTTVGISGKVNQPKLNSLTFEDVGEGMRMFILGDFQKENRKEQRKR